MRGTPENQGFCVPREPSIPDTAGKLVSSSPCVAAVPVSPVRVPFPTRVVAALLARCEPLGRLTLQIGHAPLRSCLIPSGMSARLSVAANCFSQRVPAPSRLMVAGALAVVDCLGGALPVLYPWLGMRAQPLSPRLQESVVSTVCRDPRIHEAGENPNCPAGRNSRALEVS